VSRDPGLDRRQFLRQAGIAGIGLAGLGVVAGCPRRTPPPPPGGQASSLPQPTAPQPSPLPQQPATGEAMVAYVRHSGVQPSPGQLSQDICLQLMDKGIAYVTGEASPSAAWASLFSSDDVVGIKVNQISGNIFTHPVLALAVAQRLLDVGVKPGNVIVWDRTAGEMTRNGYELQTGATAVQVRGVDGDWEAQPTRKGSFSGPLARIITQQCSALINMPCLKNHGGTAITLALKNHYGSHSNPGDHHGNECDPFIADLNSIDAIKNKTRLIICDATRACANGGPGGDDPRFVWSPNAVLVATDPVAHDAFGTQLVAEKRSELGLGGPFQAKHVATAAALGLGTNDLTRIGVNKDTDLA
jgi:uncharacterized protein (DUF362 family)